MTKKDLVKAIENRAGISDVQALLALEAVLDSITASLHDGQTVRIPYFGTFSTQTRPAKMWKDFRTGEKVLIPPKKNAVFIPGKELSEYINSSPSGRKNESQAEDQKEQV